MPLRQPILNAAVKELREFSEAGFRVTRVAEEAGCVVSVLYHHFDNREGLIDAGLVEIMRLEGEEVEAIYQELATLLDGVTSIEQAFETYARTTHDTGGVMRRSLDVQIHTAVQTRPVVRHAWGELSAKVQSANERILNELVDRGLLDGSLDIPALALLLRGLDLSRALDESVEQPSISFEQWVSLMRLFAQRVMAPR
ncbi:MAG: TetR/AcrR family transcriptional regulator [Actinomycetes bacterium]